MPDRLSPDPSTGFVPFSCSSSVRRLFTEPPKQLPGSFAALDVFVYLRPSQPVALEVTGWEDGCNPVCKREEEGEE